MHRLMVSSAHTGAPSVSESLRAYVARKLTQTLGVPDRTSSGQTVWACLFRDEPVLVMIAARATGVALHLQQAPDGSSVEVCAVKYVEVPDIQAADEAVAQLARDAGP
jgi:hypothetical protein